jgi:DNA polymerase epsilon subunit 1
MRANGPRREFGDGKRGNNTRFVKNRRDNRSRGATSINEQSLKSGATSASRRFEDVAKIDKLDSLMGFDRYESGPKKVGWLVNFHAVCQHAI